MNDLLDLWQWHIKYKYMYNGLLANRDTNKLVWQINIKIFFYAPLCDRYGIIVWK